MATREQQENFISSIALIIVKYAKQYGYKNVSGTIAQACIESGYGTSTLGYKHHNYFGMKCGGSWKGASVNLRTMEEYSVGVLTAIQDNFRSYKSMDEGVKGYYEFLKSQRYSKAKEQTDPRSFLTVLKNAGYATSSKYVDNNMNYVRIHNLTDWDAFLTGKIVQITSVQTASLNIPKYVVGQTYTIGVDLNVRTGAGKWNRRLSYDELTPNAKINDRDKNGALDIGTRVTCREVKMDGTDVWIRIPSGWVAAYYQGKQYIA